MNYLVVDANLVKYSQEKLCGGKPSAWRTQKRFNGVYSVMFRYKSCICHVGTGIFLLLVFLGIQV